MGSKFPVPVTVINCVVEIALNEYQTSSKPAPIDAEAVLTLPEVGVHVAPATRSWLLTHSSLAAGLLTQVVKVILAGLVLRLS